MNILTMNRKGKPHQDVHQYMKRSMTSTDCELELVYGSHPRKTLTKIEFLRLLNSLKNKYSTVNELNTLDIQLYDRKLKGAGLSNIRCTIEGVYNIKQYCKTNSIINLPNVTFTKKGEYKDPKFPSLSFDQIKNTDYDFRLNLKSEVSLDDSDPEVELVKDKLELGLKFYRYKKRFSFSTDDNLFRIDLTAVKKNRYNPKKQTYNLYKDLVSSKVLQNNEIYELEIEYIGAQKKHNKYPIDEFSKQFQSSKISKEDYQKQLALTTYNQDITFQPDSDDITLSPLLNMISDMRNEEINEYNDDLSENKTKELYNKDMSITPWTKASSLGKDPMELIWMNFWNDKQYNKNWLFRAIMNYNKTVHFDDVEIMKRQIYDIEEPEYEMDDSDDEDDEDDEPIVEKPSNKEWMPEYHVKYIVQPGFTDEEMDEIKSYPGFKETSIENNTTASTFYVPFQLIYGLEESSNIGPLTDLPEKDTFQKDVVDPRNIKELENLRNDNNLIKIVNMKLNEIIVNLLVIIKQIDIIVSERKKNEILEEYKTLTEQNTKRIKFLGPKPVSLSLNELMPDNPHSILHGYVVTEKADGIRAELFIDKARHGYLITERLEVIHTGLEFSGLEYKDKMGQWILDGEYITKNRDGKSIRLFMIFDIYYADNGNYPSHPYTMPWLNKSKNVETGSRSQILHDLKTKMKMTPIKLDSLKDGIFSYYWTEEDQEIRTKDSIRIGFKNYYEGPKKLNKSKKDPSKYLNLGEMGKVSKRILDIDTKKNGYEYTIDGLIYLPMYLSVNSSDEETIMNEIGQTWYQNYKWKPPEENTIDFRIKFVKEYTKGKQIEKVTSYRKDKKTYQCKQVNLYVGYDIKKDTTTDFTWEILRVGRKKMNNEMLFNPLNEENSVHICNLPMNKSKILCLKDKTEVIDNQIYEMRYMPDNPDEAKWVPLRIRDDKTRPNDSYTASSVWSTINNPVTTELISGKGDIESISAVENEKDKKKENSYYMDYSSDVKIDDSLRDFHNFVKDKLINYVAGLNKKSVSILDTSIGRGGDIGKYFRIKNNISFLLGLDISSDVNKASKRYYLEHMNKNKSKVMILQYDTSSSIRDGEGCVGEHIERNKLLIDILYDRQKKLPEELRPLVPKFKGLGLKGFDIISSQFTVHYYFKDELTLRGYIQNISDNLKKGGHFIGTCYDGMKVFQRLSGEKNSQLEMIDEFGNEVYSITKKYEIDSFEYKKDERDQLFGQEIDVYMSSIGQTITEYLVNFEMFIDIMSEYNLQLRKIRGKGFFDNKEYTYMDGLGGFELIINNLSKLQSKDSSLKQYYQESFGLLKEENKLLNDLSALNNWFIFEKIE